ARSCRPRCSTRSTASPPRRHRRKVCMSWSRPDRRLAIALACTAVILASARLAGVRLAPLLDPANHASVRGFLAGLYPPAHSPAFVAVAIRAALRTIEIAVAGTAL